MIDLLAALDALATQIETTTDLPTATDPDHLTPTTGLSVVIELDRVEWRRPGVCDSPAQVTAAIHVVATGSERGQIRNLIAALPQVADAARLAGWAGSVAAQPDPLTSPTIPAYTITATTGVT